jgi:polysaccharide export outer membrane protein
MGTIGSERLKTTLPALLVLLTACGGSVHYDYDYAKEPDPRKNEYVIGVADHLAIKVWKNPDLTTEATVRPDGTITMPLLGDLTADGKTPNQLKDEVTKQLQRYVRDEGAVVTIAVTGVNSYGFTVSGAVEHPGVFSSTKYVTVLEAMQLAGGPNRFASPAETKLFRRDRKGNVRIIPINYPAVLDGTQPQANLALFSGDQLYVP